MATEDNVVFFGDADELPITALFPGIVFGGGETEVLGSHSWPTTSIDHNNPDPPLAFDERPASPHWYRLTE